MTPRPPVPADQARVQQSFRRGLSSYHDHAHVQAGIAATLTKALATAGAPASFCQVLEFGCGTGHLTDELLRHFQIADLTLNDLVPDCAAHLQPLLAGRVAQSRFRPGPIETLPLPKSLDLIAAASTVQWLTDLPTLLHRLADHLAPGGWLALSGFARSHFAELHRISAEAGAPGYLDPADWPDFLPAAMKIVHLHQETVQLTFPDALGLLRHLRLTGVNGRARQHWTRARLAEFAHDLGKGRPKGCPLTLTYQPVYLIARKAG